MSDQHPSFWTTLPGILTGLAALITACVGVAALIITRDGNGAPSPSTSATGPTVASETDASASDLNDGADGEGSPDEVTFEMDLGDRLDIDELEAGNAVRNEEVRYGTFTRDLSFHGVDHAIVDSWSNQRECAAALERRHDGSLAWERFGDAAVCVLTGEEVLAQIRPSEPADSGRISVKVIVWE